ncbi:MAG: hypothetical protein KF724_11260 [Phycisphaeraceae bacterium]|nr:hypothetical protein [Phycisphaeraceae bacterium]
MAIPRLTGDCWLHVAYDAAAAIDLEAAELAVSASGRARGSTATRESISDLRRTPPSVQFRPKPLRVVRPEEPIDLDEGRVRTAAEVEITIYDFGAISIARRIPFVTATPDDLQRLSLLAVREHPILEIHARSVVESLLIELGDAARRAKIADPVEDSIVFHVSSWEGTEASTPPISLERDGEWIARLLRSADEPLSRDEVTDALSCATAYGQRDLIVIDWNASLIIEPDAASCADLLAVLEFANVELVEMRFLDDRLDEVLDRAYHELWLGGAKVGEETTPAKAMHSTGWRGAFAGWSREARRDRRRLAALHMDSALLFEGVNNAIKLLGDQYLARVYRLAARRLHLAEWDAAILRKIETLQRLYEKTADEQATRRMEVLEWIIIILIALSIVVMFIPGAK